MMFHLGLFGLAMQSEFGLIKVYGLYARRRLEHILDLMFSQPRIRNTVESRFGVGRHTPYSFELRHN